MRWLTSFLAATVFVTGTATATTSLPGLSFFANCGGCFEVAGEMLYMRPAVSDLDVAIVDPRPFVANTADNPLAATPNKPPAGTIERLDPHYRFGFRVSLAYIWQEPCGCATFDVTGEYTWFHARSSLTLRPNPGGLSSGGLWVGDFTASAPESLIPGSPPFIQLVFFDASGNPTTPGEIDAIVKASAVFNYDAGDLSIGRRFCLCPLGLRASAGIHFANVDFWWNKYLQGTLSPGQPPIGAFAVSHASVGTMREHCQAWAIGPKVGLSACSDLFCGIGVAGRVNAALLTGRRHSNLFWRLTSFPIPPGAIGFGDRILNTPTCRTTFVAPEVDARLGLTYSFCWCGWTLFAEAGYEVLYYFDFIERAPLYRQDQGLLEINSVPFTLNGIYLKLAIGF